MPIFIVVTSLSKFPEGKSWEKVFIQLLSKAVFVLATHSVCDAAGTGTGAGNQLQENWKSLRSYLASHLGLWRQDITTDIIIAETVHDARRLAFSRVRNTPRKNHLRTKITKIMTLSGGWINCNAGEINLPSAAARKRATGGATTDNPTDHPNNDIGIRSKKRKRPNSSSSSAFRPIQDEAVAKNRTRKSPASYIDGDPDAATGDIQARSVNYTDGTL